MRECPHKNIVHCPLYVEAHNGRGMGCDDGGLADGFCGISRKLDYHHELGRLMAVDPQLVAQIQWEEKLASYEDQRKRNMRSAAVH